MILEKVLIDNIEWNLISHTEMSYFTPKGKARLAAKTTYLVCLTDAIEHSSLRDLERRFTSKIQAEQYFNSLKSKAVTVTYEDKKAVATQLNKLFGF